ncbi:hypothetical protein JCM3775_006369 [Rhodotorula graminis]
MSTSTTTPLADPRSRTAALVNVAACSPTSPSSSVYSPSPIMHEHACDGGSPRPRQVVVTKWGSASSRSPDGRSSDRKRYTGAMSRSASAGAASGLGIAGFPPQVRPTHSRNSSSPSHSGTSSPDLSRRDLASSLRARGPAVIRLELQDPSSTKKGDQVTPAAAAPLDLGIELASIPSTYQETQIELPAVDDDEPAAPAEHEQQQPASAEAALPPPIASPVHPADEPPTPYTPYAAQVRVSVAQRVERAPSPRKGSLAELSLKRTSTASSVSSGCAADAPPADAAAGPRPRSAQRVAPPSYVISSASPTTLDLPPTASSPTLPPAPSPVGNGPGGQRITPGAKLALNLVSLSRRTAHVSGAPGYTWRLNLLEKLEVILGSFLTIDEAEAVLSIGKTGQDKPQTGHDAHAQQAGSNSSPSSDAAKDSSRDRSSFLGRVKRALPGLAKEAPSSTPASKKAVFGAPLSSKNGFVTSMIAGQRHELPGVVFSTVEEIYRRGQGKKVPGMMQQHGEPSRVAKLVQIYDTPPDYGEHHDLSIESIHNVTSLLKRYLRDLPEPVLDYRVCRLLLACVDSKKLPIKARVAGVQVVLRLQPTPNFSLLTYVLAFLSQIPLFPENSLSIDEISTLFGGPLMSSRLAPRTKKPASHHQLSITGPTEPLASGVEAASRAQDALRFLLEHWSAIADGLLEPDFDVDPEKVIDGLVSPTAPTVDLDLPGAELHIRQARSADSLRAQSFLADPSSVDPLLADSLLELPTMASPREAPAPPLAALPWSALQIKKASPAISPVVEQGTPEQSPALRSASGTTANCSDPPTPLLVLHDSPRAPTSPLARHVVQSQQQAPEDSPNVSSNEAPGTSSTRSSVSTGSDQGSELRTPPSSTYTGAGALEAMLRSGGKQAAEEEQGQDLTVGRRESDVAASLLSREELPLDDFPSPPMPARAAVRLSAFLPPSPFLSQDEIAAARAQREVAPAVPRVEVATWEHLVDSADAEFQRQEGSSAQEKALVPLPEDAGSPAVGEVAVDDAEEQESEEESEDEDELPPPVPLKHYAPRSVVVLDGTFAPLLSPSTPHALTAAVLASSSPARSMRASAPPGLNLALLASTSGYALPLASPTSPMSLPPHNPEPHLEFAEHPAHPHRREIQSLWAQLTALELERTAERAEMSDLRQEVEQFKARMAKRLERRVGLDAEERRRLDEAERRARELERAEGELRRTRDDLELVKLDATHAKEEAHRAADEAVELKAQLEKVEQARRVEQDEARAQVEALEAQLGSIRAVLLGKAAGN